MTRFRHLTSVLSASKCSAASSLTRSARAVTRLFQLPSPIGWARGISRSRERETSFEAGRMADCHLALGCFGSGSKGCRFGVFLDLRPRPTEEGCLFSVGFTSVAQTCSLSVSFQIVAGRDDFAERGCVRSTSRSASEPPEVPVLLQRFVWCLPAAAGPADTAALLWLRLRRAAPYRRFLTCHLPPASNVLPITNRRYGRLKICATLNRYEEGNGISTLVTSP